MIVVKFATVDTKKQVVMSISIPKDSKSLNMTNLITSSQQYEVQDSHVCDKCNAPLKVCTQIVDANQIIELKLDVWRKVEGGAKTVRRTARVIKFLLCNQVSIFCLTKVLDILTSVLSVLMVSGYIVTIRFCHLNAGLREPKICIWLSMNRLLQEARVQIYTMYKCANF